MTVKRMLGGKWPVPNTGVYIGRPSKWGNPFHIGRDGTREEVIAKYRNWIMQAPHLLATLPELRGKDLYCWCAPEACHGDVLQDLADATHCPECGANRLREPCGRSFMLGHCPVSAGESL